MAVLSLVIWVAVIFAGRMIGFTTTRAAEPVPADLNFEELLGLPAEGSQPPPSEKPQ